MDILLISEVLAKCGDWHELASFVRLGAAPICWVSIISCRNFEPELSLKIPLPIPNASIPAIARHALPLLVPRDISKASLQSSLTQGVNEFSPFRGILIWNYLRIAIHWELWICPENFCSFSTGLTFSAHHDVCSRQLNMGKYMIRVSWIAFLSADTASSNRPVCQRARPKSL